jgi:hypothetical protein
MNVLQQNTLHQLTGHSYIEDTGVDELFQLTDSHPFFSVPQFFLTKKLKEEKHPAFINQLQKTTLFFNNPYWLHYQLSPTTQQIKVLHKEEVADMVTEPLLKNVIEEEITNSTNNSKEENIDTISNQEIEVEATIVEEHIYTEPIVVAELIQVEKIVEHKEEESIVEAEVTTINEVIEDVVETTEIEQPIAIVEPNVEMPSSASITSFALEAAEEMEVITEQHQATESIVEEPAAIEPVEIEQTIIEEPIVAIEEELELEESELMETALPDEKIASILKEQLEEFKKPVTDDSILTIASERYHTVDYFASQGIKPEIDHTAQDTLSKQLRRFTDWLKHMKNVPPNNEDLGTDPELENAIQGIAQISNEAKEIVTETMAEVLVKQGKTDKAIQLYIKLSFLNPDKSAYFASKIQILKGI